MDIVEKLGNKIGRNERYAFLLTFALVVFVHGFSFVNIEYSHDSLAFLANGNDKLLLGRFMYSLLAYVRGSATPFVCGLMSALSISLSVVIVSRILNLNKTLITLASILFVCNDTLTSLFATFIFDADIDCFALFLACLAAFLLAKPKTYLRVIGSFVCTVALLGIYQTYLCVEVCLLILTYIKESFKITDLNDFKRIICNCFIDGAVIMLAVIVYLLLSKFIMTTMDLSYIKAYNSPEKIKTVNLGDIIVFPERVIYLFRETFFHTPYKLELFANYTVFLILIIDVAIFFRKISNNFLSVIMIVLMTAILVPGAYCFFILSKGFVHELMTYANCLIYLSPAFLLYLMAKNNFIKNFPTCFFIY